MGLLENVTGKLDNDGRIAMRRDSNPVGASEKFTGEPRTVVSRKNGVNPMSRDLPVWSGAVCDRRDKYGKRVPGKMKPKPGTFTSIQFAGCSDNPPANLAEAMLEMQARLLAALENSETPEELEANFANQLDAVKKPRPK